MRKRVLFPLLFVVFFQTTGAAIIDKETKEGVLRIQTHQAEEMKALEEQKRLLKTQADKMDRILQRLGVVENQVKAPPAAPQASPPLPQPQPIPLPLPLPTATPLPAEGRGQNKRR